MAIVKCKTCGGSTVRSGNDYVCEYCGNRWQIDAADDIHAVDRANAWASLRDGDFEKASQQFENIILSEKENHEAYWGRALSRNCITYVTDLQENKKVPTCNNITENSFLVDSDVQKAQEYSPADMRESYEYQAQQIEKIRLEWLEKASKEPAYDVFLSYKDSDQEHGIERTQDSIDAQDLYNALTEEGFKVFFSRISLRDKVAEQYEPYIYNAIKTAKVMVVFGEKPEYFNAVWVKNEWNRFKTRIAKGEKHKNSLVVVYKNMVPADLPVILKSRQCLNAADMTFLSDLTRHIKRVLSETQKTAQIEKIKISGGQVAKKAETLQVHALKTREVGQGMIVETSISEQQSVNLLKSMVKAAQWKDAEALAEDILFENPGCAEAIWYSLFVKAQASDEKTMLSQITSDDHGFYANLEKIMDCAQKNFAVIVLHSIYHNFIYAKEKTQAKLLETVLPYDFPNRQRCIWTAFSLVIERSAYEPFCVLLTTLKEEQVDEYIQLHFKFCDKCTDYEIIDICLSKIIEIDEGNEKALQMRFQKSLEDGSSFEKIKEGLEDLLRVQSEPDSCVITTIHWLTNHASNSAQIDFSKEILKYYTHDFSEISGDILKLAHRLLEVRGFKQAEFLLNLIADYEKENDELYWNLLLIHTESVNAEAIKESDVLLRGVPEYKKYLALASEKNRQRCFELAEAQEESMQSKLWKKCLDKAENTLNMGESAGFNMENPPVLDQMEEFKRLLEISSDKKRAEYISIAEKQRDKIIKSIDEQIRILGNKPKSSIGVVEKIAIGIPLFLVILIALVFCVNGIPENPLVILVGLGGIALLLYPLREITEKKVKDLEKVKSQREQVNKLKKTLEMLEKNL